MREKYWKLLLYVTPNILYRRTTWLNETCISIYDDVSVIRVIIKGLIDEFVMCNSCSLIDASPPQAQVKPIIL